MVNEFSIQPSKLDEKEIEEARALAESYFKTEESPDQMPTTKENSTWFRTAIPSCLQIIRHKKKIMGFGLILPCTKKLMNDFVSKKITEAELFEAIKRTEAYKKREAIYFCSVFVQPAFRGKGLALKALTQAITSTFDLSQHPPLFYWAYSKEGDILAKKLSEQLDVPLYKRTE